MSVHEEVLMRDMTKAVRRIVRTMTICDVTPSGTFTIEIRVPKLDSENEFVEQLETFICTVSEMKDGFEVEEIRHIPVSLDKTGQRVPGKEARIFEKDVISKMIILED